MTTPPRRPPGLDDEPQSGKRPRFPWQADTVETSSDDAPAPPTAKSSPVGRRRFPWESQTPAATGGDLRNDESKPARPREDRRPPAPGDRSDAGGRHRFPWNRATGEATAAAIPAVTGEPAVDNGLGPSHFDGLESDDAPAHRSPGDSADTLGLADADAADEEAAQAPPDLSADVREERDAPPQPAEEPPTLPDAPPPAVSPPAPQRSWTRPQLARMTAIEAAISRGLYVGRPALTFAVAGLDLTLTLASPREVQAASAPAVRLTVQAGGRAALLGLPRPLARLLLDSLGPDVAETHPDLDLLVEASLAAPLKDLEQRLGHAVSLLPEAEKLPAANSRIAFQVSRGAARLGTLTLDLAGADAAFVADILGHLPAVPSKLDDLRFGVTVETGSLTVKLGTLRTLGRGDVLLSDEDMAVGQVRIVAGGRRRWSAKQVGQGFQIIAVSNHHQDGSAQMDANEVAENALDDLAVGIVFEVSRLELPLAELQRMRPGYVLEIARPNTLAVDLTVRGQVIGKGEIVQVDNALGVRILRLFGHE